MNSNANSRRGQKGRTSLETARSPAAKHATANATLPPRAHAARQEAGQATTIAGTNSPSGPCAGGRQVISALSAHLCLRHVMPRMRRGSPLIWGDVTHMRGATGM